MDTAADWRLRLPHDIRRGIERVAAIEDRSLNSTSKVLLREALRARGALPPLTEQAA